MYSYLSFPIERKRFQDIVLNKYGLSVELLFFSGHIQGVTEGLMLGGTVKIFTKTFTLDQTKHHFYIALTIICILFLFSRLIRQRQTSHGRRLLIRLCPQKDSGHRLGRPK